MIHNFVKFVHNLRIFLFAFILVAALYQFGANPIDIGKYFAAKVSSAIGVGTSTSVPPNPFNTLASQLKERELALNAREAELVRREEAAKVGGVNMRYAFYLIFSGIVGLFALILLNFYLDYKSRKNVNTKK